jgi:hypothetical protein
MSRQIRKSTPLSGLLGLALMVPTLSAASEPDIGLNYHFLKVGLTRKAVVEMFGPAAAEMESRTIGIRQHRLTWIEPDGTKFAVFFVAQRAWRWKRCSASVAEC